MSAAFQGFERRAEVVDVEDDGFRATMRFDDGVEIWGVSRV